jgi:CheY-like chemotaxis protein
VKELKDPVWSLPLDAGNSLSSQPRRRHLATNKAVPEPSPNGSTVILVVDDDPEIRILLQTAIEWQGYKAVLARNGVEGLRVCSMHSDIRVIVCDMEMPVMGGLAFIEKVARLNPHARVIASTGGDEAHLRRAKTFKIVRATLPKPYSMPDFWGTLERVLCAGA